MLPRPMQYRVLWDFSRLIRILVMTNYELNFRTLRLKHPFKTNKSGVGDIIFISRISALVSRGINYTVFNVVVHSSAYVVRLFLHRHRKCLRSQRKLRMP
jgi:hypothetical protein